MYLLYADESGDKGLIGNQSPTKYFILSSFIYNGPHKLDRGIRWMLAYIEREKRKQGNGQHP